MVFNGYKNDTQNSNFEQSRTFKSQKHLTILKWTVCDSYQTWNRVAFRIAYSFGKNGRQFCINNKISNFISIYFNKKERNSFWENNNLNLEKNKLISIYIVSIQTLNLYRNETKIILAAMKQEENV